MRITYRWMIGGVCLLSLWTPAATADSEFCQLLDRMDDPIWHVTGSYTAEASGDDVRRLGLVEGSLGGGLLYFRTGMGEFDLRAGVDSIGFTGEGDFALPDTILAARMDLDYALRLRDGFAVQLGVAPGYYTEWAYFGTDALFYPFRIHGLRTLTPDASAMLGLNFYPGFDRLIAPRGGVRWAVSDYMLFDLFYPHTEFSVRPTMHWTVRAGMEVRDEMEYRLSGSDERKGLIYEDTRLYLGLDYALTHQVQLMFEFGRNVGRTIDFRRQEKERGLEDAYQFRIGINGLI